MVKRYYLEIMSLADSAEKNTLSIANQEMILKNIKKQTFVLIHIFFLNSINVFNKILCLIEKQLLTKARIYLSENLFD